MRVLQARSSCFGVAVRLRLDLRHGNRTQGLGNILVKVYCCSSAGRAAFSVLGSTLVESVGGLASVSMQNKNGACGSTMARL